MTDPRPQETRVGDADVGAAGGASRAGGADGRVARNFLALASGDALARVAAFAAGVWVARTLGASMYGVIGFASAVVLYFTHMAGCGVDLPGVRDLGRNARWLDDVGGHVLVARSLVSLGLALALAAAALAFLPAPDNGVLALYALGVITVGPNPRFVLLGLSRPKAVAAARTAGELLYLALVLILVHRPDQVVLVPWAQFLGDALATALGLVFLARAGRRIALRLDWSRARAVLARSFPLVVNVVVGLMIFNSDLLFLRVFRDSTAVGHYNAAYQLISFLINMTSAYAFSLLPVLAAACAREAASETGGTTARDALYGTIQAQVLAVGLPIAVGGALVAGRLIEIVFGAPYAPAAAPLAILIAQVPFLLVRDVGSMALISAGRERSVMRITSAALVLNVAANLAVIPRYGMPGAAATTLATEIARALLTAGATRRERWPALDARRVWKSGLAAALMAGALWTLPRLGLVPAVALGAGVYAATLALLGALRWRPGAMPSLRV